MAVPDLLQTPLHAWHAAHGGRLVEFGGWSMPVQYSTITDEHHAVRTGVGLFDISHMGRLRFKGPGSLAWLEYATTNNVAKLLPGQIQYSLMVNEDGGVLDDILVYRDESPDAYSVVCNASNRDHVVARFNQTKGSHVATFQDATLLTAMIAVQGPKAAEVVPKVVRADLVALKYYHHLVGTALDSPISVSRTGYTGEDGFELIVRADLAERLWIQLLEAGADCGIKPCGLGARDTLRFEAAMPLYGHEMDATVNPYAAALGWAVKLNKGDFLGRNALLQAKKSPGKTRIGIAMEGKRIARQGSEVFFDDRKVGVVTSGTFAPTMGKALAMALVDPGAGAEGASLQVDVRGQKEAARVVPIPFYRRLI